MKPDNTSSSTTSAGLDRAGLLRVALQNGIPAAGVIFFGWSVSLILLLYWLENLIGSVLWNRLIRRHEAATHLRGHYRRHLGGSSNNRPIQHFATEHFNGAIIFTLAQGLFLFVFAAFALDGPALLDDALWVLVLAGGVVAAMVIEVQPLQRGLEQRSFAWVREQAQLSMWPVMAMHVGVIFGGMALVWSESGVLLALAFIAVRVVVDLARARGRKKPVVGVPDLPPQLAGMEARLRNEYGMLSQEDEIAARLRDEEFCPPEERPGC